MLTKEAVVEIRILSRRGMSIRAIARELKISRNTVRKYLRGEAVKDVERRRPGRPRKLGPYEDWIRRRVEGAAPIRLPATVLHREIKAMGYDGTERTVRRFIASLRPTPAPEPVVRYETPPGHQTQVDFATFNFPWGKRYALMVVLGHSRLLWLRFYERQNMWTLIRGLEEAFRFFGGVTTELLFDQMKAVITGDLRLKGGQLVVNEEFLRFATHWGFRARACRPYRAQTKGKVERPIAYLRDNFVYGRDFISDAHLDEERLRWLERANSRVHGTTRQVPREHFERDEQALLQPLAARPYQSLVLPEPPPAKRRTALPSDCELRESSGLPVRKAARGMPIATKSESTHRAPVQSSPEISI